MKHAWARWVLVVCNALIALAFGVFAMMAFSGGSDHHVGGLSLLLTTMLLVGCGVAIGSLAYQQSQRRGRVGQTVLALIALSISAISFSWPGAVYGAFALLSVWWLGDFVTGEELQPLTGAPDHVARVMWRRGQSDTVIRTELAARHVPADEIEKLMYQLVAEDEARHRMSPGA